MQEPKIDEEYINAALYRLIDGASCDKTGEEQNKIMINNPIHVNNNDKLDASNLKGTLVFEGNALIGGIYDEQRTAYLSDDLAYSFHVKDNVLTVNSICSKQSFVVQNFDQSSTLLNLNLSKKPNKEIALVLCTTSSMNKYVFALKEIAPFFAKQLFKPQSYTKVSIVKFANLRTDDLGTFYDPTGFVNALKNINTLDSDTRLLYYSCIKAMENFTKDNKLKKELYLLCNDVASDASRTKEMLKLTQNLNKNIIKNSKGSLDNCVKIHSFSLDKELDFLQDLAHITGGSFYYADNSYNFKKALLNQSSGGTFDMREIDNEIRPAKNHKMHDDDNPPV